MSRKVKVLDRGYVQIIRHTGDDRDVADMARVSFGAGAISDDTDVRTPEQDYRLVHFLMRHRHLSPFSHQMVTVTMKMPMFIRTHVHRHVSLMRSYNEASARYSVIPDEYYVPDAPDDAVSRYRSAHDYASDARSALSGIGESNERSRIVQPQSQYTRFAFTASLRDLLFGFLRQRLPSDAQWEIRQYAEVLRGLLTEIYPVIMAEFDDNVIQAHTFSGREMTILRGLLRDIGEDNLVFDGQSKRDLVEFAKALAVRSDDG